jgi:hypothetical protein
VDPTGNMAIMAAILGTSHLDFSSSPYRFNSIPTNGLFGCATTGVNVHEPISVVLGHEQKNAQKERE